MYILLNTYIYLIIAKFYVISRNIVKIYSVNIEYVLMDILIPCI